MNIAQALRQAHAAGLDRLDARLLLLHALGRPPQDRAWLIGHDQDELPAGALREFEAHCARRAAGEPVAYLVGEREFHGLSLAVDRRVLVPRPDTETLVEWALDRLKGLPAPRVVDLGTGSGAVALAIKARRPDASVDGVDLSADALAVAQANALALGLAVTFRQGSWLDGCTAQHDLIVGNPPYIREGDPHLPALRHEPQLALVSGADGLDAIRAIVRQAPAHLLPGGWLLLEHGWDQAEAVRALLAQAGLAEVQSRRDLAGIERCSGGRRIERG